MSNATDRRRYDVMLFRRLKELWMVSFRRKELGQRDNWSPSNQSPGLITQKIDGKNGFPNGNGNPSGAGSSTSSPNPQTPTTSHNGGLQNFRQRIRSLLS